MPDFEFHVSRAAREKYGFDEALFALDGRAVLADFAAARRFAGQMSLGGGRAVPAGEINAMGLIDEIQHILIRQYERQDPGAMRRALDRLGTRAEVVLLKFVEDFPPLAVLHGELPARRYLDLETASRPNRQSALEELLLLHVANLNPALGPYRELFDDDGLRRATPYEAVVSDLETFFAAAPSPGSAQPGAEPSSLFDLLLAPARKSPDSLRGQLEYLLERWRDLLGEAFVLKILRGIDFVREEALRQTGPGGFGGEAPVLHFAGQPEYERFSQDRDWMPRLVLIARNSYVWLDQLSKKYGRAIQHLDQVPDEELELLRQRGITGLWLIGLWERSLASRRIKQRMGNPEAVASAYSLLDYQIAGDLGGWPALENLRARAWGHGVRLSADMVPNHMGIDSRWVVEHPDWFLSLPYSPYPNYSFDGPDLSSDARAGIFIEDHYYSQSDAAVVFKRLDRWTGEARYLYHGNDGTAMPWNDTAQLDYSQAAVREAVIQTILHVARNFPIIRFDAAMTLARKHIQRLWFPAPGSGGDIPSRAEHGLTQAQFDAAMPGEFWREVVDRVAAEVPDTLLLAEAFWMMEGYFVRTLGMHRVYNSAFMHMLRDEKNAEYRQLIKNTLEFDPQILKRYVNFMNNPDEKTAVEQFGSTDKYFGVCTMMVTLPGLPMFGHGQIEGWHEKYGMEYRRAHWDEPVDEGLVRGHEWSIFPLTHRRALFAEVDAFLLYDFYTPAGHTNEDVFAYSNRQDGQPSLVLYHNRYAGTSGWVKTSAAFMDKGAGKLVQKDLAEGLGLPADGYAVFKDYVTGLEYIRSCRELAEKGLFVQLGGYQRQVFLDWRVVSGEQWKAVCEALTGEGVPSIQSKVEEMVKGREVGKEVISKKKRVTSPKAKAEGKGKPAAKAKSAGKGKPAPKKSTRKT